MRHYPKSRYDEKPLTEKQKATKDKELREYDRILEWLNSCPIYDIEKTYGTTPTYSFRFIDRQSKRWFIDLRRGDEST